MVEWGWGGVGGGGGGGGADWCVRYRKVHIGTFHSLAAHGNAKNDEFRLPPYISVCYVERKRIT